MDHPVISLLVSILPLVVFSSVSPVVFLNASTAVSRGGQRGGWRFVLGNAIVLGALGLAFVGLLGTAASSFAQREIASRAVDRALGVALVGYGGYMALQHRRTRHTQADAAALQAADPDTGAVTSSTDPVRGSGATGDEHAGGGHGDGLIAWGALGMATNFTTLPVFAAVSQRIGAADIDWGLRVLVLALCWALALAPSWLPVLIARFNPRRGDVSTATRARIAHWTSLVSVAACFVGGIVLVATSL